MSGLQNDEYTASEGVVFSQPVVSGFNMLSFSSRSGTDSHEGFRSSSLPHPTPSLPGSLCPTGCASHPDLCLPDDHCTLSRTPTPAARTQTPNTPSSGSACPSCTLPQATGNSWSDCEPVSPRVELTGAPVFVSTFPHYHWLMVIINMVMPGGVLALSLCCMFFWSFISQLLKFIPGFVGEHFSKAHSCQRNCTSRFTSKSAISKTFLFLIPIHTFKSCIWLPFLNKKWIIYIKYCILVSNIHILPISERTGSYFLTIKAI